MTSGAGQVGRRLKTSALFEQRDLIAVHIDARVGIGRLQLDVVAQLFAWPEQKCRCDLVAYTAVTLSTDLDLPLTFEGYWGHGCFLSWTFRRCVMTLNVLAARSVTALAGNAENKVDPAKVIARGRGAKRLKKGRVAFQAS